MGDKREISGSDLKPTAPVKPMTSRAMPNDHPDAYSRKPVAKNDWDSDEILLLSV